MRSLSESEKELTTNMASSDYYNLGELSHVIKVADLPSRYQIIKANKNVLSKEFKVGYSIQKNIFLLSCIVYKRLRMQ